MTHSTVFERNQPHPSILDKALASTRQSVFWLDEIDRPAHAPLTGSHRFDLAIVGGGFHGLWTALRAKERYPDMSVCLVEAHRVGWAASGRNGGFAEASLTHGDENGARRWPKELATLDRLGRENLDGIVDTIARYGLNVAAERTGTLSVAVEPHQVAWIAEEAEFLDTEGVRAQVNSPTYLAGLWDRESTLMVNPAALACELARAASELGIEIFERSPVRTIDGTAVEPVVVTNGGSVTAKQVVLATNVFPSLLRRNRLMTVPVYDYVLVTEPLSNAQLLSLGWSNRQGVADMGNQFHYYRLTDDNRILFGGYDAVYFAGGKVRAAYEDRPQSHRRLAGHFFATFPQLEGLTFTHKWAGAIDSCTRFCAYFGVARGGSVAYAAGFTGLGVAATRFAADVCLDLLAGEPTERTELQMVRERPLPFPPEPVATAGIQATRWSMNRADHNSGNRNLFLRTMDAVGLGFDS